MVLVLQRRKEAAPQAAQAQAEVDLTEDGSEGEERAGGPRKQSSLAGKWSKAIANPEAE